MTTTESSTTTSGSLASFVAWLATRERYENVRARLRSEVEHYLRWCAQDAGDPQDRVRRYLSQVALLRPHSVAAATDALDRYVEHRRILAITRDIVD